MAFTNADALVKAKGSTQAFFGTNPICLTTPLQNEEPFCLDMATSMVSWNKIKNYRREGIDIPDTWAYDAEGKPVTNPNEARSLEPAGDYKGFGLGMMVDVFCGILANGLISKDILAMYNTPLDEARKVSHFFMVIDPEKFLPLADFKQNMQSMVDRIREMPTQEGVEAVMVPGDPEKKTKTERLKSGIPILEDIWQEFLEISPDFKRAEK
jgi:ureidoglycolate dehydrogenase (NAD+)